MKTKKLNKGAIVLWNDELYSLQMIGDKYGVSRQAVKNYLNRRGIDTRKRDRECVCAFCHKVVLKPRSYIRSSERNYCNRECYFNHLRTPGYTRRKPQTVEQRILEMMERIA